VPSRIVGVGPRGQNAHGTLALGCLLHSLSMTSHRVSFAGLSSRAPTRSRGPVEGSAHLMIVTPQAFFEKNEGDE
jgi:hypothetical protein